MAVEKMRKRAEETCVELELEIEKRKSEYEALEIRFWALEGKKRVMEEEIRAMKSGSGDEKKKLENGMEVMVDLDEDDVVEDRVFQLMLENKVLECEKMNSESEVEAWNRKFKELESWVLKLDKDLVLKGGECPLMLNGHSVEVSKRMQPNERAELEEGLKIGVGMESLSSKDTGVNGVDLGSMCHSPGKGICHMQASGTSPNVTFYEHRNGAKEEKTSGVEYGNVSQARKQLELKI